MKSEVYLLGGGVGIGHRLTPVETFDDKEDAQAFAKRRNKMLSPGEKKYFKMKYVVRVAK